MSESKWIVTTTILIVLIGAALVAKNHVDKEPRESPDPTPMLSAGIETTPTPAPTPALAAPNGEAIDPRLFADVTATGRVTDANGAPIGGAQIRADNESPGVFTNEAGIYVHPHLDKKTVELAASAHGYAPTVKTDVLVTKEADSDRILVDFVLEPGGKLTGRVIRRWGGEEEAVAGATIAVWARLLDRDGHEVEKSVLENLDLKSGEDGSFTLESLPYATPLNVWAQLDELRGGVRYPILLEREKEHEPVLLVLPSLGKVAGRVVDQSGAPVVNAELFLFTSHGKGPFYRYSLGGEKRSACTTDAEGRFVMEGLTAEASNTIQIDAEGFACKRVANIVPARVSDDLRITLTRGSVLAGTVVMGATKSPVPGVQVIVKHSSFNDGFQKETTSAADGSFRFDTIPLGTYRIGGQATGDRAQALRIEPKSNINLENGGGREDLELEAWPPATIRGRALCKEDNTVIARAAVRVTLTKDDFTGDIHDEQLGAGGAAVSDRQGAFELTGLAPGVYRLSGSRRGYLSSDVKRGNGSVTVAGGEIVEDAEVILSRGGTLEGVVLGRDGAALPQIDVSAGIKRQPGREIRFDYNATEQKTDKEGRFRISGLPLGNEYRAQLSAKDSRNPKALASSEWALLTEDAPEAEVTISLADCVSLSGAVADSEGAPIANVVLVASRHGARDRGPAAKIARITDAQGHYEFPSLSVDVYDLAATKRGYVRQKKEKLRLEAGKEMTGVDFSLQEGAQLIGMLADLNAEPVGGWTVTANVHNPSGGFTTEYEKLDSTVTSYDGSFDIPSIGGEFFLTMQSPSHNGATMVFRCGKLAPSNETQIFVIPIGGGVRGRVVSAETGEPIAQYTWDIQALEVLGRTKSWEPEGTECALEHFRVTRQSPESPDGEFRLERAPLGAFRLSIRGEDLQPRSLPSVEVTMDMTDLGDIEVNSGASLVGRLVDAVTGDVFKRLPTEDIDTIHVSGMARRRNGQTLETNPTRPDDTGRFTLTCVPRDTVSLQLRSAAFLPLEIEPLELAATGATDLGDIRVSRGGTLAGRLVDARTGEPYSRGQKVLGTVIKAIATLASGKARKLKESRMDNDGIFRIHTVPYDVVSVTLMSNVFSERTIEPIQVASIGETDLGDILISDEPFRVVGRFAEAEGVPLQLGPHSRPLAAVATTRNGALSFVFLNGMHRNSEFYIESVPGDTVELLIYCFGYLPVTIDPLPEKNEDGIVDLGDVIGKRGATVRGYVLAPDGSPASASMILAYCPERPLSTAMARALEGDPKLGSIRGYFQLGQTTPEGTFEIHGLYPSPCIVRAVAPTEFNEWAIGKEGWEVSPEHNATPGSPEGFRVLFPPRDTMNPETE